MDVCAVWAEMIVDDVQHDHQPQPMGRVHQCLQLVRRAVCRVRRKRQHAVIAPVMRTWEISDRHQFDSRDAELLEPRQLRADAVKAAKCARVQFVDDRLMPRPAVPIRMLPLIMRGIDDEAGVMHVARLRPGRGIWEGEAVGKLEFIVRASFRRNGDAMPAAVLHCHWVFSAVYNQRQTLRRRRPNPEPCRIVLQLGAEREREGKPFGHRKLRIGPD